MEVKANVGYGEVNIGWKFIFSTVSHPLTTITTTTTHFTIDTTSFLPTAIFFTLFDFLSFIGFMSFCIKQKINVGNLISNTIHPCFSGAAVFSNNFWYHLMSLPLRFHSMNYFSKSIKNIQQPPFFDCFSSNSLKWHVDFPVL